MDRLCVFYEKLRRVVWQGIRVSAVCTACYGWWGVIYTELAMLPSTYDQDCTERCGSGRMEFRQSDLLEDPGGGSGTDPLQEQTAYDVKKIEGEIPCIRRI